MLSAAGYRGGWAAIKRMPEPVAASLFRSIADRTYERNGRSVQQLRKNLARIVPADDLEDVVHEGLRRYLRYWLEAFRLPAMTPEDVLRKFVLYEGEDRLSVAIKSGRGVVCALPHMGNWDLAGAWVNQVHAPLTTVVERLKREALSARFVHSGGPWGWGGRPPPGAPPPFRTLM